MARHLALRLLLPKARMSLATTRLHGEQIVKQLLVGDSWYLVFLVDNNLYEETLRVFLLDQDLAILDGLKFGAAYVSGTFEDFKIRNQRSVSFKFVHTEACVVKVHESLRIEAPIFAAGVRRIGWSLRRYLKVKHK